MTEEVKNDPAAVNYTIAPYTSQPNQVTTISPTGMTLDAKSNNIKKDGDFNLTVWGHQNVSMLFNVSDGSALPCAVVGIAISPDGSTDPSVRAAFPRAEINSAGLKLKDHDPSAASYEFYLLVQNGNGDLGLIDPLITNTS